MRSGITFLALLATLGYACRENNTISSKECSVKSLMAQEGHSYDELANQLLTLVQHDWNFTMNLRGEKNYSHVAISIPATDATDDRISGKGSIGDFYSPESISPDEGYMVIGHSLCQSPELIINGVDLTGNKKRCDDNPGCLDGLVKHIREIDRRNGNTFFADQVKHYANAVEKRYNHGIKRK